MSMTSYSSYIQNGFGISRKWRSSWTSMPIRPLVRGAGVNNKSACHSVNPQDLIDVVHESNTWTPQNYVGLHCGKCANVGMIRRDYIPLVLEAAPKNTFAVMADESLRFVNNDSSNDQRNDAVAQMCDSLRRSVAEVDRTWRNELLPARANWRGELLFAVERAVSPLLGLRQYGSHVNGYVRADKVPEAMKDKFGLEGAERHLAWYWVGVRSKKKQTWPGLLDQTAAGAIALGQYAEDAAIREIGEETGLNARTAGNLPLVRATGATAYSQENALGVKRDVLFNFDMEMDSPYLQQPHPLDGEAEEFDLMPQPTLLEMIASRKFKPNCALVALDFVIRHGGFRPDQPGYCQVLQALRAAGEID